MTKTERLTAIEAELAKMRDIFRMSVNDLYTTEKVKEMVRCSFGWGCESEEGLSLGFGGTLGHVSEPTPTRTYPAVEWRPDYKRTNAFVGGIKVGYVATNYIPGWHGDGHLGEIIHASLDEAKSKVEDRIRRWWDELHTTPTPTP